MNNKINTFKRNNTVTGKLLGFFLMTVLLFATLSAQDPTAGKVFKDNPEALKLFNAYLKAIKTVNPSEHKGARDYSSGIVLLYQNKIEEGNALLQKAIKEITAGDMHANYWQMRLYMRGYYLFYSKSTYFPGRLSAKTESDFHEFCLAYAKKMCIYKLTLKKYTWAMATSSENHYFMNTSGSLFSAMVLRETKYIDYKLTDGKTVEEHFQGYRKLFMKWMTLYVKKGFFTEKNSSYGGYVVNDIFNMYDFAPDEEFKAHTDQFLNAFFADFSLESFGPYRGGAAGRLYQGSKAQSFRVNPYVGLYASYVERTIPENWGWGWDLKTWGYNFLMCTSHWKPSPLIKKMGNIKREIEPYAYISQIPGKLNKVTLDKKILKELHMNVNYNQIMHDTHDVGVVRYTFVTGEHIMGSYVIDPNFAYSGISKQNRWQGIIFNNDVVHSRVYPQCFTGGNGKTYNQHISVHHENVMVVQMNKVDATAQYMRVFFATKMIERLIYEEETIYLEEGDSFLAVRFTTWGEEEVFPEEAKWEKVNYLITPDKDAPIVFITGLRKEHTNLDNFKKHIKSHKMNIRRTSFSYTFNDRKGEKVSLTTYSDTGKVTTINKKTRPWFPDLIYDSPYFQSPNESGTMIMRLGEEREIFDVSGGKNIVVDGPDSFKLTGAKGSSLKYVYTAAKKANYTLWLRVKIKDKSKFVSGKGKSRVVI